MYVSITETIVWMKRARQNFDDHYSTALKGRVSCDRKNG
jgi:hypothetical protein